MTGGSQRRKVCIVLYDTVEACPAFRLIRHLDNVPACKSGWLLDGGLFHGFHSRRAHTDSYRVYVSLFKKLLDSQGDAVKDMILPLVGFGWQGDFLQDPIILVHDGGFDIRTAQINTNRNHSHRITWQVSRDRKSVV